MPAPSVGSSPSDPQSPVIVWFRRDLRTIDNPALCEAAESGRPIVPVYILEDDAPRQPSGAARWWLHHSLKALCRDLTQLGSRLILRRGRATDTLLALAAETGARTVVWNRRYERQETGKDCSITSALVAAGLQVEAFDGSLLFSPKDVRNRAGAPFQVFTSFWRCCLAQADPPRPRPRPTHLPPPPLVRSESLADWVLLPRNPDWSTGISTAWTPGEDSASARLADFLEDGLCCYGQRRDHPDQDATSRLSPHLAFGEISPRQVWYAARAAGAHPADGFLRQLGWREFCHHTLFHFPHVTTQPLRQEFEEFPWNDDETAWQAFITGQTGYPIVDAGMRALWETGWLHNRLRMIVASFLVKDLMIPWQRGESWFWDTLVDADLASNSCCWQWVAGCGLESAPYFRVFNPTVQGEKFDPRGLYVRRWLPELAGLPDHVIHRPWEASSDLLARAGVTLGKDYPRPIVDHDMARKRALAAFERMKSARTDHEA
ncbi:deoxyribodipyrimidine photo-lyase [Telmatospirillum sp.]|uniref:cryptochrome/photolyase family protein n=1 Tax=Telmatospirillum sp. TaxID=2079197 RepID=UPI00284293DC|nr:deoxyribodipyrimidine photo-lyase [Telmatospirillum sp.]MDR3441295.1 deoxyribodipyrimidine photo-lyase [Telmatospirillum sp.]